MFAHDRPSSRPGPDRNQRPARGDDGVAAVEMAIVLPVLLLVLFMIIDMGRLLQQHIQLTEAAREGARAGALNATAAQVRTKISTIVGSGAALSYPTAPQVCSSGALVGADSTVTVTRTFQPATPIMKLITAYGGTSTTVTIRATGVMACVG